ncbi:unnamed protein product [Anisakis simplex]|uniref:Rad4/PNGase transglutaminase-like fold domain-containing protein n=1 Tax=Anisakis simplex TaxID=6269 RepID=A0A3P6PHW8_ANISI|nr:unnamed protein product [Anisakis simplex]
MLCYIAHLRVWMRSLVRSEFLSAQCLSLIPEGYVQSAQLSFDTASVERFMKWFHSAFVRKDLTIYLTRSGFCDAQVERLGMLISDKVYETPKDIASILVLCLLALKQSVRLCLSCYPVSHKPDLKSLAKSDEKKENEASSSKVGSSKTSKRIVKESTKDNATSAELNESASEVDWTPKSKRQKGEEQKKKFKKAVNSSVKGITVNSKKKMPTKKVNLGRNYWVEYWDEISEEWICIDPMKGTIDMAELIESDATSPMHYVIAIDNELSICIDSKYDCIEFGMRDVTARYASKYLSSEVRRLRIDEEWWKSSLMVLVN